jgi:hypothetical protein
MFQDFALGGKSRLQVPKVPQSTEVGQSTLKWAKIWKISSKYFKVGQSILK